MKYFTIIVNGKHFVTVVIKSIKYFCILLESIGNTTTLLCTDYNSFSTVFNFDKIKND